MPSKEKTEKIQELRQKLSALKEERKNLNIEARKWMEKRDKLNEHVKKLRTEIQGLKSERDELNREVKKLKRLREETKTEIHEKIREIKKLNQEIEVLAKKKSPETLQTLQKKLEKIEWEIQTTSLSLKEEKRLVDQVRQLETQMNIHKKLGTLNKKRLELQTELKAVETKNRLHHEKLIEKAQRSQKAHNKMLERIDEIKELAAEADRMHQNFLNVKQRMEPIQRRTAETLSKMQLLKKEIKKEEEEEKKKIEEALRKKIEKKAKEKLKRGGKLTWEEFQILAEKERLTQD